MTDSMTNAIRETERRRNIQMAHNIEHNITPTTIVKDTGNSLLDYLRGKEDFDSGGVEPAKSSKGKRGDKSFTIADNNLPQLIRKLEKEMKKQLWI